MMIKRKEYLIYLTRGMRAFYNSDIIKIGSLLQDSWDEKKKISPLISAPHVSKIYSELKDNNMVGGKLLGAGGSGFIFGIMKTEDDKINIKRKYRNKYISLDIDESGSQIINK